MYKQNSEFKSVQKKLMAAIAMVLIASIMVVSSSYAWFTLSTAPEVTGITTSVGSNGNLEMALRDTAIALENITAMASGGNQFPGANKFWGNLVDLSSPTYGLSEISLAPARLNVSKTGGATTSVTEVITLTGATGYTTNDKYNGYTITAVEAVSGDETSGYTQKITYDYTETTYAITVAQGYLKTAVYGADGRVSALETNTDIGIFNAERNVFAQGTVGTDYGVKAIGVMSGLSDAELALRNAKNAVYGTIVQVTGDASTSLSQNASKLANILVTYYLDNTTKFNADQWNQINDTLLQMEKIAKLLENALDQAVIAVGVYQNQSITDVSYEGSAIVTTGGTIDWTTDTALAAPHASLLAAYADLAEFSGKVANAKAAMPAAGAEEYEFSAFEDTLAYLMTTSSVKIVVAGTEYSIREFKDAAMQNVSAIVTSGMTVRISSGLYADIAEFVGNYSGSANISADGSVVGSSFAGQTLTVPTTMETAVAAPATGYHLVYANTWLPNLTVQGEQAAAASLTDLYAYLIDFAFRTNASGSSLMLQTTAKDRVSETNGIDATMGAGSYMEFEIGTGTGYTMDQMLELLKAVRIVFIDGSNKVVAVAALDLSYYETLRDAADEESVAAYAALTKVNAPINLYNYSFDEAGVCTLGNKIAANDSGATALMDLVQNTATALSTLVYLDGDLVDNGDVAINGTSVTGTMNLQFASSADLVPMEYTFTAEETEATTPTLDAPNAAITNDIVTWNAVDNATSYRIAYYNPADENDSGYFVPSGDAYSFDLKAAFGEKEGVTSGTEYVIAVIAMADGYNNGVAELEYTYNAS